MAASNITRAGHARDENARADALTRRIAGLDPAHESDRGRVDAVALGLVDTLLDGDEGSLRSALDALRAARARTLGGFETSGEGRHLLGALDAFVALSLWGSERLSDEATAGAVTEGTRAHDFLRALDGARPVSSSELRQLLEVDETQVSRTGRQLLEAGLVARHKIGRRVFWELTPRGRRALEDAPVAPGEAAWWSGPEPAGASFWFEALRQGFEAAGGDEPGERRSVDPTGERIVACTRALHTEQGILATTWPQIASRAGVAEDEVSARYPTLDELVRACGRHVFMDLRLPPPDRAADLFLGASSEGEQAKRLVRAIFHAYEREGAGFEKVRGERAAIPALDESLTSLDAALDALVAEVLGPRSSDPGAVASIRALTDLAVWRTLRDRGAPFEDAVEQASAAVERWLEARATASLA